MLIIRFAVLYLVSMALLVILFSAFTKNAPDEPAAAPMGVKEPVVAPATVATSFAADTIAINKENVQLKKNIQERDLLLADLQLKLQAAAAAKQTDKKEPDNLRTEMSSLQAKLSGAESQVASLRKQLAAMPKPATVVKTVRSGSAADAAEIQDLQKRNQNLVAGFKTMQTQMGMLQKNYNILKAENNRLASRVQASN